MDSAAPLKKNLRVTNIVATWQNKVKLFCLLNTFITIPATKAKFLSTKHEVFEFLKSPNILWLEPIFWSIWFSGL